MQTAARDQQGAPSGEAGLAGRPLASSDRAATVVAAALGLAFAAAWTWLGVYAHDHFTRGPRDFMIYLNAIWNTGHGLPYQSSVLLKNTSHLAEHVAPLVLP